MLCIPTYVAPSRISGMGLFSAVELKKGARIWMFADNVDWRITKEEFAAFPEPYRARMQHYVYEEESGVLILCGDNAKFMNHDPNPNCSDADPQFTVTLRPIRPHEELTCNYLEFDRISQRGGLEFQPLQEEARRSVV